MIAGLIFSFFLCVACLKADCFLQLCGYRAEAGFWRYFKSRHFFLSAVFFLFNLAVFIWASEVFYFVCFVSIVILASFYFFESKKTPFNFTKRARRLLATQFVLCLVASCVFIPTTFLLIPFIALLANAINKPFEFLINRTFIEEAKIKLKNYPQLKIIGITGSYGKTSVKNILYALLKEKYKVIKTPESFNTPMGIVKTINVENFENVDFFICEMGARKKGDINEICEILKPDISIVTGIAPQHMETFKTMENLIETKSEIILNTVKDGTVFFNGDCEFCREMAKNCDKKHCVCGQNCSDFAWEKASLSNDGTRFEFNSKNQKFVFKTKLLGLHNVSNICLCAAVAYFTGLNGEEIARGVEKLEFSPHRLQLIKGNGLYILDDSYNANIDGIRQSAKVLKLFEKRKFAIVSGIVEGGKTEEKLNEEVGKIFAEVCDAVFLVGKNSCHIKRGMSEIGYPSSKIVMCQSTEDAVSALRCWAERGDVVLFSNDLPDNVI